MKTLYYLKFCLILVVFVYGCSKDSENGLNIRDLEVTIEENPSSGLLIGNLMSGNTDGVQFSIVNQSPENAFLLNSNTGEIRVNDASLFDFETTPQLNLTAFITDGTVDETAKVTVDLDDMDDILYFLNASKQAYLQADPGEWVLIDELEYDALKRGLNEISFVGPGQSSYAFSRTLSYSYTATGVPFTSVRHEEDHQVAPNGYIFAFKYMSSGYAFRPGSQVKQADGDPFNPLTDVGGPLPYHELGFAYFVLKGNNTPASTTGPGYLGFYSILPIAYFDGKGAFAGEGNLSQIVPYQNAEDVRYNFQYEALISTQKQWD
ncbi:cadherin repeat domain-containing protein [uncultured Croceitalea sp.]|uniref:cadherin repeat domain-containing protein n=1 Tax=uncultured Croceitalea sp. TaxID=1798908 RepID=UPI00330592D5